MEAPSHRPPSSDAREPALTLRAWIGMGSNLGDRAASIGLALDRIDRVPGLRVRARSSLHETEPVGGPPGQGRYLNGVAELQVAIDSSDAAAARSRWLLANLLDIERSLGRVRDPHERHGPRIIDLDLLLVEIHADSPARITTLPMADARERPVTLHEPAVELPHPRLHERRFVLAPLAEIAPDLRHPSLNATIAELLARLPVRTGN